MNTAPKFKIRNPDIEKIKSRVQTLFFLALFVSFIAHLFLNPNNSNDFSLINIFASGPKLPVILILAIPSVFWLLIIYYTVKTIILNSKLKKEGCYTAISFMQDGVILHYSMLGGDVFLPYKGTKLHMDIKAKEVKRKHSYYTYIPCLTLIFSNNNDIVLQHTPHRDLEIIYTFLDHKEGGKSDVFFDDVTFRVSPCSKYDEYYCRSFEHKLYSYTEIDKSVYPKSMIKFNNFMSKLSIGGHFFAGLVAIIVGVCLLGTANKNNNSFYFFPIIFIIIGIKTILFRRK